MGPIGAFESTYKYTYLGPEGKFERITIAGDVAYLPPDDNRHGVPFKITAADVQCRACTGTILFDPEKVKVADPKAPPDNEIERLRDENERLRYQLALLEKMQRSDKDVETLRVEYERLKRQLRITEKALEHQREINRLQTELDEVRRRLEAIEDTLNRERRRR
jgi:hypothetical protein